MKGSRTNYGKVLEGKRITLRLYGNNLRFVKQVQAYSNKPISLADAVQQIIKEYDEVAVLVKIEK
jgi:hypothetical protein